MLADWDGSAEREKLDWPGISAALASDKEVEAFAAMAQLALEWPKHQEQVKGELLRLSRTPELGERAAAAQASLNASQRVALRLVESARLSGQPDRQWWQDVMKESRSAWLKEELKAE